ncbi:hypothetical protein F4859DRAFT_272407 [Xylaria cf. heliscus]|nr:hypothetical protein F4859DRAFT_272407 [Xylaria cf. heliscus]
MAQEMLAGSAVASGESQSFYIFGHNISHSLSPTLHNAGFQEINFGGHYRIHESPDVDESVVDLIKQPGFGGASVTFPHKLQIGQHLDYITTAASAVGAVNTVVVDRSSGGDRRLVGDNTDWSGIRTCILQAWKEGMEKLPAVVLGAGGAARAACFAIQSLGIREVILVNRTRSSAEKMIAHFPELRFSYFPTLREVPVMGLRTSPIQVIIGCIPVDNMGEPDIPEELFTSAPYGVVVEMAYRPLVTPMMQVTSRYAGWAVFNGTDVLKEQAYAQFELWTGQKAPSSIMSQAMQKEVDQRELRIKTRT